MAWVILELLKSYQRPQTQLEGLKKKFASDMFSNVSTHFQFQSTSSSSRAHRTEKDTNHSKRESTDQKGTISADKTHTSQKTLSSTQATSTKKASAFQFN